MQVSEFDYEFPPELIAQQPAPDRSASRMLHMVREKGSFRDLRFTDLPGLLRPDDLLVFNNSRVFPARLFGARSGSRSHTLSPRNPAARDFLRGRVEVLLTRSLGSGRWEALVRPGRKIGVGERLFFASEDGENRLEAEVVARGEFGERTLQFAPTDDFFAAVEAIGHIPLPPYIARQDEAADRERYQTVFAQETGSAAAPTAGLHFTPEILQQIRQRGIETAEVTLHVGLGTFQPLHHERVEDNTLHYESYRIVQAEAERINRARRQGRRIVAVGTTTVRTLESAALRWNNGEVSAGAAETKLFIYPGFQFRVVGALLTNFHLPQSSLLMLVCAFAGREQVLDAYRRAVRERYRLFSYGDCMFVE